MCGGITYKQGSAKLALLHGHAFFKHLPVHTLARHDRFYEGCDCVAVK